MSSAERIAVVTANRGIDLGSGVLVNEVCPGWVRTRMGGGAAPRSVAEDAETIVWAATLPVDGPTGGFFQDRAAIDW